MTKVPQSLAPAPALDPVAAEQLARRHDLVALGERPPLGRYLVDVWRHRSFLWTLSRAETAAKHQTNRLGQLWAWLNPLLLIGSYFVVFGLIIQTTGAIHNKIGFLAIGVVLFQVIASVVNTGSKSIVSNMNLMRALHFPRAILPLSVALTEFLANLPAFAVLFLVMILTGERPSVEWLLFPLSILMLVMMLTGMALIGARIINMSRDLGNLIPVSLRLLRYVSGVFFPIAEKSHGLAQIILMYQPFALPLQTAREALMYDPAHAVHWPHWAAQAGWSVGFLVVGIVVFWVDEARYGRG